MGSREKRRNRRAEWMRICRIIAIVLLSFTLNLGGRWITLRHDLPFWLDSLGILVSAYVLGPISGGIVGAASNVIVSSASPESLVYALVSVFIGVSAGIYARKGGFRSLFSSLSYGAFLALGTSVFSGVLNLIFSDGSTTNQWGDAVIRLFRSIGVSPVFSVFLGAAYLEFVDKLVTVSVFWLMLQLCRGIRGKAGAYRKARKNRHNPYKNGEGAEGAGKGPKGFRGDFRKRIEKARLANNARDKGVMVLFPAAFAAALAAAAGIAAAGFGTDLQVQAGIRYASTVDFDSYSQTAYNASNGLVSGHATDVSSGADGSLWIGSYAGLYRYNGQTFEQQEQTRIKSVNCLYTDDDGRLFVGTNDSGLVLITDGEYSRSLDAGSGLCSDSVRNITQASDGSYYIGTSNYLERVSLSNGMHVVGGMEEVAFTKSLAADKNGNVAAVTEDGELFLVNDGEVLDEIVNGEDGFSAVLFDPRGNLFAGTENGVLFRYVIANGRLLPGEMLETGIGTVINDMSMLEGGAILILTDQGLYRLEGEQVRQLDTGTFTHSLEKMTIDYQGNIWIASTRDGLLELSDSAFSDLFRNFGISEQLVNAGIEWDGNVYIGCDGGLIVVNREGNARIRNALSQMLGSTRIRYFAIDHENRLYIATYGEGLIAADTDGSITKITGENSPGNRVRTVLALSDGTVVASGEEGVSFIQDGTAIKRIPYGEEFGNAAALCFAETADGVLAGTDGNGLFLLRDGEIEDHYTKNNGLGSDVILKIIQLEGRNSLLLVTSNSIAVLQKGLIRTIGSFPYSNNYDVLQGDDGKLYITGSAGIYITTAEELLNDKAGDAFLIGPLNGLDSTLTVNSQNLAADGMLYLCTGDGLLRVRTEKLMDSDRTIRMKIRSLRAGNDVISVKDGVVPTLSRDAGNISIDAEIINFSAYLPVIRYCLDGYETEWHETDADALSGIMYGQLPAGDYTFRLQLVNRESGKVEEQCLFSFSVDELLEDTMGFKVYFVVTTIAFAAWIAWFITRVIMQRRAAKAEQEARQANMRVAMGNKAIISIARALYAKDQRTGQHSYNVAYYSTKLAEAAGFSEKECQNIRKAALLHDIGKIAIPDAVLNKPGRLTDEEYAVMKTHTTIGAEILSGFTLIDHVSEGAKYHHERYDGKGYPDGIAGENIPLYGRLIAVADAYDAMTANRVYRQKLDVSYAAEQIRKGRGTQFDPRFADLFLELIEKGEVDPEKVLVMYENRDPEEDIV